MDTPMLHLVGPCRDGSPGMIAGDTGALMRLRAAIDMAIANGIGSAELFSSDYEPYDLLVVAPPNMWTVCTAYAGEVAPVRTKREALSLEQLWQLHSARTLRSIHANDATEVSNGALATIPPLVNVKKKPKRQQSVALRPCMNDGAPKPSSISTVVQHRFGQCAHSTIVHARSRQMLRSMILCPPPTTRLNTTGQSSTKKFKAAETRYE